MCSLDSPNDNGNGNRKLLFGFILVIEQVFCGIIYCLNYKVRLGNCI